MHLIVSVAENGGILFLGRRVSRDREIIYNIEALSLPSPLYIDGRSESLFADCGYEIQIAEDLKVLPKGAAAYVEFDSVKDLAETSGLETLVIYRFHRDYPASHFLDLDPKAYGLRMTEIYEFPGYSHDLITREIYRKI